MPNRRRNLVPLLAVVAAVVVLAGVVTAVVEGGRGKASTPTAATLPLMGLQADGNPDPAIAIAGHLLDDVVVPPGSKRLSTLPPALAQPLERAETANLVDGHLAWTTPLTVADLMAFLAQHRPVGASVDGTATLGFRGLSAQGLMEEIAPLPAGIESAELLFEGTSVPAGSDLRVDAAVIFTAPRTAGDTVPRADHVVTVTGTVGAAPAPRVVVVTDGVVVEHLAAIIDSLPAATPDVSGCPAQMGGDDVLAFSLARGAAPNFVATEGACNAVTVTGGGALEATLSDAANGSLKTTVAGILAGRLTAVPS